MTQVVETVESLERERSALAQRITALVEQDAKPDEVARLVREKTALSNRITDAKAARDEQERQRQRQEREQAEAEWPKALAYCSEQRAAFLEHRRAACIALGNYLKALARAYDVVNRLAHETLGPLPQYLNACRALELGDSPERSLADLEPAMGADWKTTFAVTPRYETHNSKRGE
jgi:hypothetical protein